MGEFDLNIEELRKEYLDSIQEDFNELEQAILELESSGARLEIIRNIFRIVHSVKGGAGSYQLMVLSSICHRFEDRINEFDDASDDLTDFVDKSLKYVDVLRNCAKDYESGKKDVDKYISYMEQAKTEKEEELIGRVLLVETTQSISKIFKKVLKDMKVEVSITDNGLEAFERLVNERFDALITSVNVESLDGLSVISAMKVTNNINSKIPTVVLSSDEDITKRFGSTKPDHVLIKDMDFVKKIKGLLDNIFNPVNEKASELLNNVLYVEDDKRIQKIVDMSVKKYSDINLRMADTKAEAFKVLDGFKPDLILLDNILKECKGVDILKELALDKDYCDIPIVFLTASPKDLDLSELKKIGNVLGILPKPINVKTLTKQLSEMML